MLKKIFITLVLVFLFLLIVYIVQNVESLSLEGGAVKQSGAFVILLFSLIVIARYFILLLLSLLNILKSLKRGEKESFDYPFISIIVPCYNEGKVIKASLGSLIALDYPNYEILVIDDGSSDDTYLIAKDMEFDNGQVSLRAYTKTNAGKANALNYGIDRSYGELFVAVDADSKLSADSLILMAKYFDDEKVAAVAGSVYVTNTHNLWTKLQALEYIQGLNFVRNGQAYLQLVNIIPGPIGMFRKAFVRRIGMYKDDTYAEDCDLTLRLLANGYKVDYEIDAVSYTEAPETLLDLIKQRYRWTRGILQSIMKHKNKLFSLKGDISIFFVMWYMVFEAILWPIFSILANIFIIYISVVHGFSQLLFYWWLIFTALDVSASIYCVSVTKESLKLVLYSIYYRLFFINIINIVKVFASIEEIFSIEMNWGKLERIGRI
jgi:cellulose synthase/poly-beta-1,6-N-acetylglucosamine synthase-like glycosyltransferase